eukprot:1989009-Pleurochrysis_carterae.AAC.1
MRLIKLLRLLRTSRIIKRRAEIALSCSALTRCDCLCPVRQSRVDSMHRVALLLAQESNFVLCRWETSISVSYATMKLFMLGGQICLATHWYACILALQASARLFVATIEETCVAAKADVIAGGFGR